MVLCTCTPSSADNNKKPDDNKRPDDEEQTTPKPEEKPADEKGKGKLSYIQVDKTMWPENAAGLSILDVSNGGQPVMSGPMPGDCWQFETTGKKDFPEGTQLHMVYTYNPGKYGAKYWMIEYKDGKELYASTFPHCSMKSSEYLWPKTKRLVKDERRSKSKLRVCA